MQQDFAPVFPRSVSGRNYRPPLNHPDIEALGQRMDAAYQLFPLSEATRAVLLKTYDGLKKGSVDCPLVAEFTERTGKKVIIRPAAPWRATPHEVGVNMHEHNAGFVERVREFLDALDSKYTSSRTAPALASDDI